LKARIFFIATVLAAIAGKALPIFGMHDGGAGGF
jgi:hypothetical protein